MISHRYRCIFVHIPKTAGSSLEDVIWPEPRQEADLWMGFVSKYRNKYQTGGLQHLLARQIRDEVGSAVFNDYFKFAFVRNPWDKAVSQFSSMAQRPDLRELIGMNPDTPFHEYLHLIRRHEHVQWQPQVDFLYDENGTGLIDFVGRFETLEKDTRIILERLGITGVRLPRTNPSKRCKYPDYYDTETREQLRELYRSDIEAFGYNFIQAL